MGDSRHALFEAAIAETWGSRTDIELCGLCPVPGRFHAHREKFRFACHVRSDKFRFASTVLSVTSLERRYSCVK